MSAIKHLQQHEIRHVRDTTLPRGTHALGNVLGPLAHQPGHFPDETLKPGRCPHTEHGGDEVRVHHQAAVRALFQDPANGQGRVGTAIVPFQHQFRGHPGHVDGVGVSVNGMQVPDFLALGPETASDGGFRPFHFRQTLAAQRQGQIHHLVGHGGISDLQGFRHHVVLGQAETGAVRKQAAGPYQAYPAKAQVFGVQLQIAETVQVIRNRQGSFVDLVFQVTLLLLEVLGLDEQPITPDDSIRCRHQDSSDLLSLTSRSRRLTSRW